MHRDKSSMTVAIVCTAIAILCGFIQSSKAAQRRPGTRAKWLNPASGFDLDYAAQKHFGNLTQAEKALLRAARVGDAVVCSSPQAKVENSEPDDAAYASDFQSMPCWLSSRATDLTQEHNYRKDNLERAEWQHDRNVRAALIRWLLVNPDAFKLLDPKGIWI